MNADVGRDACEAPEEEWQQYTEWEEWRDNTECGSTSRLRQQSELRHRTDYLCIPPGAPKATQCDDASTSSRSMQLPPLHVSSLRAPPSAPVSLLKPAIGWKRTAADAASQLAACSAKRQTNEGTVRTEALTTRIAGAVANVRFAGRVGAAGAPGPALPAADVHVADRVGPRGAPGPALEEPSVNLSAPLEPESPLCLCGDQALWYRRRWVCMKDVCGFEHPIPPVALTPVCHCGLRSLWHGASERFWCGTGEPPHRGGCGLEQPVEAEPRSPTWVPTAQVEKQIAADTAALLTAAAYGLGDFCFVAPSEHGLGLWSREPLVRGQAVVEYAAPRLSCSKLVKATYALEVPDGRGLFIDGNFENCGFDGERSPAIYANHSRNPNLVLQHWPAPRGASRLWLVAKEDIPTGRELRFDYEDGGSIYWHGRPPMESKWRAASLHPPPSSGHEPTVDFLPALLAGEKPEQPTEAERRGWWHPWCKSVDARCDQQREERADREMAARATAWQQGGRTGRYRKRMRP